MNKEKIQYANLCVNNGYSLLDVGEGVSST